MDEVEKLKEEDRSELKSQAARHFFSEADLPAINGPAGEPAAVRRGEANRQGRPQRILHLHRRGNRADAHRLVETLKAGRRRPAEDQYRYRPREYGEQLVRMYLLANDEESNLGTTPLPDGVVRVFRDNGRDGLWSARSRRSSTCRSATRLN